MLRTRLDGDLTFFGAAAKCFASDVAMSVTTDAVQLLGGYGYTRDYPLERMMRDAKSPKSTKVRIRCNVSSWLATFRDSGHPPAALGRSGVVIVATPTTRSGPVREHLRLVALAADGPQRRGGPSTGPDAAARRRERQPTITASGRRRRHARAGARQHRAAQPPSAWTMLMIACICGPLLVAKLLPS